MNDGLLFLIECVAFSPVYAELRIGLFSLFLDLCAVCAGDPFVLFPPYPRIFWLLISTM